MLWFFCSWVMWELSFLTRDLTHIPALECEVVTTGPPGKSQIPLFTFVSHPLIHVRTFKTEFCTFGIKSKTWPILHWQWSGGTWGWCKHWISNRPETWFLYIIDYRSRFTNSENNKFIDMEYAIAKNSLLYVLTASKLEVFVITKRRINKLNFVACWRNICLMCHDAL